MVGGNIMPIGAPQFNNTEGYVKTFKWNGSELGKWEIN